MLGGTNDNRISSDNRRERLDVLSVNGVDFVVGDSIKRDPDRIQMTVAQAHRAFDLEKLGLKIQNNVVVAGVETLREAQEGNRLDDIRLSLSVIPHEKVRSLAEFKR